jgi:hypothetical protein
MDAHEFTLHTVSEWGECKLSCVACGEDRRVFQSPGDAILWHGDRTEPKRDDSGARGPGPRGVHGMTL